MTKKTMTIVSVFMVVALTAVGFAAWLITGTIDYKAEGSFVANELDDKYFKVEVVFDAHITDDKGTADVNEARNNGNVIFGRPDEDEFSANDAWLSYSVNDEEEKLTVIATVKFIPDGGFSRNIDNQEDKDMEYYLYEAKESGSVSDPTITEQYRTIRVKIDINELFNSEGVQTSTNYQWFDWAVQLGYIQYPTAHVVEEGKTYATATNKLSWVKNELDAQGNLQSLTAETDKFKDGYLYIDLTKDMFEIQYANESATEATEAIAKIEINFNWGTAVSETTGEGESKVTTYFNPYNFFLKDTHKPEEKVNVNNYLKATVSAENTTYSLVATEENIEDDPSTPEDEDTDHANDKTIRYKDLAQRMLDYIRDHLNYTAPVYADDGETITTPAKGIQFSFELLEGEPEAIN